MKNVRKKMTMVVMTLVVYTVSSCSLFDLDINTDPNNPAQASLALLLTNVELNASDTYAGGLNDATMGFMGITTSIDDFNMTNSSWNGTWNYLYSDPLKDLDGILKATAQQRADGAANPYYEGIAKVLKAYYFSLMVDLWGDIPYSQAFAGDAGEQILAPQFDDDATIYANLITLCDEAIAHFDETSPVTITGDVIYGGSNANIRTRWGAAARSLKLRLLLNKSRADASAKAQIDAIIAASNTTAGALISVAAGDFQFQFGTLNNPDDRHPTYRAGYAGGEAGYTYYGHQFMYELLANDDPRRPFYLKRQTSAILDPNDATQKQTMPCSQRTDCKYSYFPKSPFVTNGVFGKTPEDLTSGEAAFLAGFFGRDRSDPSGVPNDATFRTNVGVYPAGGLYDDGPEPGGGNKGRGSGIFPMITSWMVKLYMLEAHLALGSPLPPSHASADLLFRAAMNEQFAKVSSLGTALDPDAEAIANADRDAYVDEWIDMFNNAADNNAKLRVVLKQAWFMNFGNGFEIYNAFRRTGFPSDLQLPLQTPRNFALRLPYALDEVNLNANTPTVIFDSPNDAVFWDVLKFQF